MPLAAVTQGEQLRTLVSGLSLVRAHELRQAGFAGSTIQRALQRGDLVRIGRGLYQSPQAEIDGNLVYAEVAKRIPKGIIAIVSALAFHRLTVQIPRKTWVAIAPGDWSPVTGYPPVRIVRLAPKYLTQGVEHHAISGVDVPVFSVTKTLADLFRNSRLVDRSIAVEGLRAALELRKATPTAIAEAAQQGGAWRTMRPYLEAMSFNR